MPWTPRQVRYLESSGSPLTSAQKDKMNRELHADPSLGHHKKGSDSMTKAGDVPSPMRELRVEIHRGPKQEVTGHTVHHHLMPTKGKNSPSGAFMEETHHSYPFGADGQSSTHGDMMDHIGRHLGMATGSEGEEGGEGEQEEEQG